MAEVIRRAFLNGITIQSDWARANGAAVAMAASLGLITSFDSFYFSRTWRPTRAGLRFLEETV